MRNAQIKVLDAPVTASANGPAVNAGQIISASFVTVLSDATASGTLKVQVSNDNPDTSRNFQPTNWSDLPNSTSTISGGVGPALLVPVVAFAWMRVVFVRTTGVTGNIVVLMNSLSV